MYMHVYSEITVEYYVIKVIFCSVFCLCARNYMLDFSLSRVHSSEKCRRTLYAIEGYHSIINVREICVLKGRYCISDINQLAFITESF